MTLERNVSPDLPTGCVEALESTYWPQGNQRGNWRGLEKDNVEARELDEMIWKTSLRENLICCSCWMSWHEEVTIGKSNIFLGYTQDLFFFFLIWINSTKKFFLSKNNIEGQWGAGQLHQSMKNNWQRNVVVAAVEGKEKSPLGPGTSGQLWLCRE